MYNNIVSIVSLVVTPLGEGVGTTRLKMKWPPIVGSTLKPKVLGLTLNMKVIILRDLIASSFRFNPETE
jgi:hypothetical protein